MRNVQMAKAVLKKIKILASLAYPEECCGLLLGHADRKHSSLVAMQQTKTRSQATICSQVENLWQINSGSMQEYRKGISDIIPMENEAGQSGKRKQFYITPLKLYEYEKKAEEAGYMVLGIYHSHPDADAVLSREDEAEMLPDQIYVIISATKQGTGKVSAWRKVDMDSEAERYSIEII